MKIVTVEQMRAIEARAVEAGVSEDTLMESAGLAVARRVGQWLDGVRGRRVLVLVGPGNNGGDGMVAARYLSDWGALVTLYMTAAARREDKFEECRAQRVRVVEARDDLDQWALSSYLPITDLVIDAVLGLGADRPLDDGLRRVFRALREARSTAPSLKLVAVDVPSGVNADTGEVDEAYAAADLTLTLGAPKLGLFRFPGAGCVGRLETLSIGLPDGLDDDVTLELADAALVRPLLPRRRLDGHKGTFGHVALVAGSRRFVGAAVLAATAAYRGGAGLVTLASPEGVYRLAAPQLAEPVHLPLPETPDGFLAPEAATAARGLLDGATSAVIGPGMGDAESVREFLQRLLLTEEPLTTSMVLDADALNALARTYGWSERLTAPAVLTPHPGEMSRLLRSGVAEVQADRVGAAQRAARDWGHVVVLKGAHTVVAAPDGRTALSPFANPALASGGTGDVLSGVIGALLAQGLASYEAGLAGVYVHAAAAERVREELGDAGLMASDLLPQLPRVMRDLRQRG